MRKKVIVTASGSGSRMSSNTPKQFLIINKKPVLFYTIEQFYKYSSDIEIILTLNNDYVDYWKRLINEYNFTINHRIIIGGETRYNSVKNAINSINENCLIAIHDAVRPFVSLNTISECFNLAEKKGNAVPFSKIPDSIRKIDNTNNKSVNRSNFVKIQTPQVFKFYILKKAYNSVNGNSFTDDASIVENIGEKINLFEGNQENFKITTPFDLKIAKTLLID